MTRALKRFETIPTIITVAALALTMSLGIWQLQRLAWKEGLIAQAAVMHGMEPLTRLPINYNPKELVFHPVRLRGKFLNGKEFHLAPRYHNEKFGYHILTPLRLIDGRTILVDRGWVPAAKKAPETRPESIHKSVAAVKGILREPQPRNIFMLKSKPEQNIWFWQDLQTFSTELGRPLQPLVLEVVGEEAPGVLPVPSDGKLTFHNDHLGYAMTWFAIAVGILIIFVTYHRKPV